MYYDVKQIFSTNIKRIRKLCNLTQEQFAEKIGMQWKSVVNYESARNLPNSISIEKICNTLNVAPAELFLMFNEKETKDDKIQKSLIILNKMDIEDVDTALRLLSVLEKKNFKT